MMEATSAHPEIHEDHYQENALEDPASVQHNGELNEIGGLPLSHAVTAPEVRSHALYRLLLQRSR
jgi:hypothetical protein